MLNKIGQIALVAHGRQRDGMPESGLNIMKRVKEPLGDEEITMFVENNALIPDDWQGKIAIFWDTAYDIEPSSSLDVGTTKMKILRPREKWVKGMHLSGGLWHVESFPVDDDFSPRRLSAEIVRVPWWKRMFYRLIGKNI